MTITDDLVAPVMKLLADGSAGESFVAGESAVAGLAGMVAAACNEKLAAKLGLDNASRVLVFGTEGATDAAIYESLVGRSPQDVAALFNAQLP